MNRIVRSSNGNGRNTISITHWNEGNSHWINKLEEIQALIDELAPDLLYISEANFFKEFPDYMTNIPGYRLVHPKQLTSMGYSRLILLVKEGVQITLMDDLMCPEVSSIWLKIAKRGCKKLHLGGVYREHDLLRSTDDIDHSLPAQQLNRWRLFIDQWDRASIQTDCIVLGDLNLDLLRWASPEYKHSEMVDLVKNVIETKGFVQMVQGITRSWPNQADSTIYHCWTNAPHKLVQCRNLVRSASDHNVIDIKVRVKGHNGAAREILSRNRSNFNEARFKSRIAAIDWTSLYETTDVNVAAKILESNICDILNFEAPWMKIQVKKKHKSWVSPLTKEMMRSRDTAKELARVSKLDANWQDYRNKRNACTKQLKSDKKKTLL